MSRIKYHHNINFYVEIVGFMMQNQIILFYLIEVILHGMKRRSSGQSAAIHLRYTETHLFLVFPTLIITMDLSE